MKTLHAAQPYATTGGAPFAGLRPGFSAVLDSGCLDAPGFTPSGSTQEVKITNPAARLGQYHVVGGVTFRNAQ